MYRGNLAVAVAAMDKLESVLQGMSSLSHRVAIDAAPKISALLFEQFKTGRNPYGQPWAPLAASTLARGRRPPPLTDTRKLRDGCIATARPGGISIRMGRPEWYFHQVGFRVWSGRGKARHAVKVPAREILPSKGWPRRWLAAINESAAKVARDIEGGR